MTDRDDLDLTPQQRSALRRADENPEQLTEHDGRILGELLANGDDDSRKEAASSIKHASAWSEAARLLTAEVGRLTAALDDEVPLVLSWTAGALGNIGAEAPEQVSEAVDPLITLLHYRPGYLRVRSAAATALGKIGAEAPGQVTEAIGPLVSLLDDEASSVRGVAAAALADISRGAPEQVGEAIEPLAAARDDEDRFVRNRATDALRNIGRGAPEQGSEAADPLVAASDDERAARRNACRALLQLEPDAVADEEPDIRRRAARALGHAGADGADGVVPATERLCGLLSDDDGDVRRAAALAFGRLHAADRSYPDAVEEELVGRFEEGAMPLGDRLDDERTDVAVAAAFALFRAGSADHDQRASARDRLREGLESADHRQFTVELVAELAATGPAIHPMMREVFTDEDAADDPAVRDLVPDLVGVLNDDRRSVRRHACRALGHLDAETAVDDLGRLAREDDDGGVREAARDALERIGAAPAEAEDAATSDGRPAQRSPEQLSLGLAATAPEPGGELSRGAFEIEGILARTANAVVREATVELADGETREEFVREARIWSSLDDHANVVDVVGWGTDPPWIATAYAEAGDLRRRLDEGPMAVDEALWTAERIADALEYAHNRGVNHFDLKPANVLLGRVGDTWDVPMVADWGLARFVLDHSGSLSGYTTPYAPPELIDSGIYGTGADRRTDLYQLGVILYEALAGEHPFPDRQGTVSVEGLTRDPPVPSEVRGDVPAAADGVVTHLLEPRPTDRYAGAAQVREALRDCRTGDAVRGTTDLADRAALYTRLLEYAREESLRECERWAEELRTFVEANPVDRPEYQRAREQAVALAEDGFYIHEETRRPDDDLLTGGGDLASEDRALYDRIGDVAFVVRRCYARDG